MRSTTQPASFDYLIHHGYANLLQSIGSDRDAHREVVNTIFKSGIIGSLASESPPIDTWGNVKIPRIEYYESRVASDNDGWFKTTIGSSNSYCSVIGIPVSGTNSTKYVNYRTNIQTPYLQTACSLTLQRSRNNLMIPDGMVNFTGLYAIIMFDNATQMRRSHSDPETLPPLHFRYSTRLWKDNNYDLNCNLSSTYVETEITCSEKSLCMATKLRRSRVSHPPTNWTQLDLYWNSPRVVFSELINSVSGNLFWPTILDRYLSDPSSVITLSESLENAEIDMVSLAALSTKKNYSIRLAQLLNSYFTFLGGVYSIAGGLNDNTAYKEKDTTSFVPPENVKNISRESGQGLRYQFSTPMYLKGKVWSARGTKDTKQERIVAHDSWVITLCISSIVLILASLISPVIHFFFIKGPEVMMNLSSLAARNNQYIPLPEGGTYLGASMRARLLKSVQVRFGDIEQGTGVGRLVIGAKSSKDDWDVAKYAVKSCTNDNPKK